LNIIDKTEENEILIDYEKTTYKNDNIFFAKKMIRKCDSFIFSSGFL
jgi:hypothetical protein